MTRTSTSYSPTWAFSAITLPCGHDRSADAGIIDWIRREAEPMIHCHECGGKVPAKEFVTVAEPVPACLRNIVHPEVHTDMLIQTAELVISTQFASVSIIRRRMKIGLGLAGRLMDCLEEFGAVGPHHTEASARDVLIPPEGLNDLVRAILQVKAALE